MKRRILSVLLIVMLLCSSMAVTSFAETTEGKSLKEQVPEAVVLVQVENAECKMIEKMTDLTVDIKLKDGRDVINVPVEKVEAESDDLVALWLGYSYDEIDAQIKADMAEFQKDYHLGSYEEFIENIMSLMLGFEDMSKDLLAIFENYEIVINGIPEDADHKFEIETNTMLITSTIVSELFYMAVGLIGEIMELSKEEIADIDSFTDIFNMMNEFLKEEGMLENGKDMIDMLVETADTDEINREELVAALAEMDAVLAYMTSEEYTGTVFAGVYMECECPFTVEYTIYHQYFKEVDGKMTVAGTVNNGPLNYEDTYPEMAEFFTNEVEKYYYEGISTDVIYAKDHIQTEYNGETYEYKGSYASSTLVLPGWTYYWTDEADYDTIDDIYASDEWWTEYKYDKIEFSDDEEWDAPTGLILRYELLEVEDNNPETGDDSNMAPFYVIMMLAMAVMAAAVVTRRRQRH